MAPQVLGITPRSPCTQGVAGISHGEVRDMHVGANSIAEGLQGRGMQVSSLHEEKNDLCSGSLQSKVGDKGVFASQRCDFWQFFFAYVDEFNTIRCILKLRVDFVAHLSMRIVHNTVGPRVIPE